MTNEEKILELLSAMNGRIDSMDSKVTGIESDVAGLKTDVAGIRMDVENRMNPQLQALAEGQKTILETLAPKNRVEALEEEVDFMKRVINTLAKDVDEIKKSN